MVYMGAQTWWMLFCVVLTQNACSKSSAVGASIVVLVGLLPKFPYTGVRLVGERSILSLLEFLFWRGIPALVATRVQPTEADTAFQIRASIGESAGYLSRNMVHGGELNACEGRSRRGLYTE